MKRLLFGIVMLFCISMTINAQGLKTYSGKFNMVLGGFHIPGKATYTYKNADDGTRIYEGNFNFIDVIRPNVCYYKVVGKYHNDLKHGLWTYINKSIGTTEQLKVCYAKGYVDGLYEYSKLEKNVMTKSFKGVVRNGVPIGPISGKLIQAYFEGKDSRFGIGNGAFTGQTDENGLPDGTWKFTSKYYVYYERWSHGVLNESYCIENSTGDKYIGGKSSCLCNEIYEMISRNPIYMEYWVDRGCKAWDGLIMNKERTDKIKSEVSRLDDLDKDPVSDYGGYSNDEAFIQANSTIPNILYKLNGTEVKCILDERGNVTDVKFTKSPDDPAVAKELERCLGLLKYKPAMRKGGVVKCEWGFGYDGNKSLSEDETKTTVSQGAVKKISREDLIKEMSTSQLPAENTSEEKVFDVVEEMPSYIGGQGAMMSFLASNIQYPVETQKNGVQGRVMVEFIVEKDGTLTNVRVARSVEPSLDKEAVRVVKSMPKWKPGKQNGAVVRVRYTAPIVFRLK